jgi:hypothetical protein
MVRVLIRSLPNPGTGKGVTLGLINLHTSRQLELLRSSARWLHHTLQQPNTINPFIGNLDPDGLVW